ncbi:nucleolar complex-associated protein-domain-containing protein [Jimgerdemannia flammicorona]|uniref:Nucleolar complex-associated protein 3 n=1 Tax=Jimgerdemannia flammicorona TaxID=994334 RepID=A0A433DKB3_9FUNG|nr:nucleolar complex-associated protein-domain-containing protein [Jimgerdemannia flammicorona]
MPSQKKGPKPAKGFKPKKNTKPAHPGRKNKKKDKSTKIPNKVITPVSHEEEDPEISDEDLEFFEEHDEYSNFLTSLDTTALSKNEIINAKRPSSKLTKDGFAVPEPTALSPSDDEDGAWSDASDEDAKAGFGGSDEEQEYELKARKVASDWTRRDTFTKLPIKLANGRVMQQPETEVMEEDSDSGAGALEEENADGQEENEAIREERDEMMFVPTAAGGLDDAKPISKKAYLLGKKELLADIAQKIIENPEGNIGQLKRLRKISQDENQKVRQLAFLTQLAVYKDIIPGYRIRALSDKERTAQVSKDVKMLRNFEQALLVNYQNYLQDLENESRILPLKPKSDEVPAEEPAQRDEAVALVAVRCMCDLLTSVTHFNFRTNLMTAIVSRMSTVKWTEMLPLCCDAIIDVFQNDESGEASLDAVKVLTRMVKSKGYIVNEAALNTLLHLRLREELVPRSKAEAEAKQARNLKRKRQEQHRSRKQRKIDSERKEVEKELKEAEAMVNKEEKEKMQTETLKLVFATYFRILKHQKTSPLLPAVLEGLAKFTHLINVDFFEDLLEVLKKIMMSHANDSLEQDDVSLFKFDTRRSLLCIITAFKLLSGQGEAFNIDLKDFYTEMYSILLPLSYNTRLEDMSQRSLHDEALPAKVESKHKQAHTATEEELMLMGLELLFFNRRQNQIPKDRAAAFVKRLALTSLNMPSKTVVALLNYIRKLLMRQPLLDALLSSEDKAGNGVYLSVLDDPELCNPFATSLWELQLLQVRRNCDYTLFSGSRLPLIESLPFLQIHYDPKVRGLAKSLSKFEPVGKVVGA